MKHFFYFAAILLMPIAFANVYIPKAKLAGVSVCVWFSKDTASVTAVFEFADTWTKDDKVIFFPIFASKGEAPVDVLAKAKFEITIGDKVFVAATPCEAPRKLAVLPEDVSGCWFKIEVDEQCCELAERDGSRLPVRLTYSQPLIGNRFYYLPIIPHGDELIESQDRDWRFQLVM